MWYLCVRRVVRTAVPPPQQYDIVGLAVCQMHAVIIFWTNTILRRLDQASEKGGNSLTWAAGGRIWLFFAVVFHDVKAAATEFVGTEPALGGGSRNSEHPNHPAQTRRDPECSVASDRGATLWTFKRPYYKLD